MRMARADRLDLALLHRAQELHLHFERQVADLVEEQGAAIGVDEFAAVLFGGPRKGALLVAEEDALDQIVRDGATVDGDERLAQRLLAAWIARATISLPTPDSPSSTIGMLDCAARRARSITRIIAGLADTTSSKPTAPPRGRREVLTLPSRLAIFSALPSATDSRSAKPV